MARAVGRNVLRKEGREKVSGAARYIDDLSFPHLLHARTIRSTIPAGEIAGISLDFDTSGFTIVDCRDVPGRNIVALIDDDQPCLASGRFATSPSRCWSWRMRIAIVCWRPPCASTTARPRRTTTPRRPRCRSSQSRSTRAISPPDSPTPTSSSKGSTALARRSSSTSSRTA